MSGAGRIAGGIFASRVVGFLRDRAIAYYFGLGAHADVWTAVLRGPNILQNLLGEGTLSAAFIPIYSRFLKDGREEDAGRFAGAVFGLLVLLASAVALVGIALAPLLVWLLVPGFREDPAAVAEGLRQVDRFALAVTAVRFIFPMTGLLVLSAWALGVLNSHRRFLLPYLAPVAWNLAILAGLFAAASGMWTDGGMGRLDRILLGACLGALVGGLLQLGVQLPLVLRLSRGLRVSVSRRVEGVSRALAAFGPVVAGRGVYQVSAYLDVVLASFLAVGALSALRNAQALYVLPVSLFGLAVAQAELPELSRLGAGEGRLFLERLEASWRRMAFFTLPTTLGYLVFGFLLVGGLYRTGEFGREETWLVYLVLGGYSLGIPATTTSRLLQNSFYALGDTRFPARVAAERMVISAVVAVPLMLGLDRVAVGEVAGGGIGQGLFLGALGLSAASALGAWWELLRLGRGLGRRVEGLRPPWRHLATWLLLALAASLPALALAWRLPPLHPLLEGLVVPGTFAVTYLVLTRLTGVSELGSWLARG